jgi:putative multiple sugar transport system permease protein
MSDTSNAAFKANLRENGMLMALIAIMVFFTVVLRIDQNVDFMQALNITNLFLQNSHVIILALGMLLVIVAGHIDLSVGSVAAFVGAAAALMSVTWGLPTLIVIPVALAIGGLIGAAQGYWIAYWNIPSFIVTLSGMMVFRGATLWLLGGQNIGPFPDSFEAMSTGYVPDVLPFVKTFFGLERLNGLALLIGLIGAVMVFWLGARKRAQNRAYGITDEPYALFVGRSVIVGAAFIFIAWKLALWRGLPNVVIVMTVLTAFYAFFTESTTTGRRIYAIGGNRKAAALSGINVQRLTFLTFVNMGILAALAGMVVSARLNSATPKAGDGFELDAIAAVFIGGASMAGGSGKIMGVVVGAFIMGVMNNGMSMMSIGIDYQQMIKGLVLLAAVIFDVYNKQKQG